MEKNRRPAGRKIIRIATDDNFWKMGDTGPCGPCSEIFYDHGPISPAARRAAPMRTATASSKSGTSSSCSTRKAPPGTRDLPRPSIDTGMGLERFAAILQGKHDNYDTDTLRALILASAEATGQSPDGQIPHQPPRRRRPSAQHLLPDRRWRAPLQ